MATVLADWKHFVKTPEDDFYTPSLVPAQAVGERDKKLFTFFGFVIRQCFVWGLDTLPISPLFLAFLFKDFAHATTPEFIEAVSPRAAKRLASWPPKAIGPPNEDGTPPALVLDGTMDPMLLIIELVPGVTVCC
jgi:hypothetical protein